MKTTEELLSTLSSLNIDQFFEKYKEELISVSPHEFLNNLIINSSMRKAEIIEKSDFDTVYFYQILSGRKTPSRDKLLRLLIAMKVPFKNFQLMLRLYGHAELYPRLSRDSIIIYSINNGLPLEKVQQELTSAGEEPIR